MAVIQGDTLVKTFGQNRAIDRLSFTIDENKITGIVGRNGAGKTTLLKLIAGYYKQTSGQIEVMGHTPFNNLKVLSNLVFIDDSMAFPRMLSLSQILAHAAAIYSNWDIALANGLVNYFGFDLKQTHHSLSKGKKSTFNMILGLAAHAKVTIFDEPTTGMDIAVRKDFYRALLKDYIACPRTILISSHLLSEVEDVLEDILLIKNGTLCVHQPIDELRQMAIGLRGKTTVLSQLSSNIKVFHREGFGFGNDQEYIVVDSTISKQELDQLINQNVEILHVEADDLCFYLTATASSDNNRMGGIDDVFKRV